MRQTSEISRETLIT